MCQSKKEWQNFKHETVLYAVDGNEASEIKVEKQMGLNLLEDSKIRSGKGQAMPCSWMGNLNIIKMSDSPIFYV